jgi:hypothetical protein
MNLSSNEELELAALLSDPSVWAEPSATLEDDVVAAVVGDRGRDVVRHRHRHRHRYLLPSSIVAAAAAIVIVVALVLSHGANPEYTAALGPTELAPTARASAVITRSEAGYRITLDAHGLPSAPAGEYYQAWLKNSVGASVPVGTFSSSDGQVTLWSGVSPTDFPTLSVTIETAGPNAVSSGRRVLVGDVRPQ